MLQFQRIITSLSITVILMSSPSSAAQEKSLEDFSATVRRIIQPTNDLQTDQVEDSAQPLLRNQLHSQLEILQAGRLLLVERLHRRESKLSHGNAVAKSRHQAFATCLGRSLQQLDTLRQRISRQSNLDQTDLHVLKSILLQFTPTRPDALHCIESYRPLHLQSVAPATFAQIVPVYQEPSPEFVPTDLQISADGALSQAIYQQAIAIAEVAGKQNRDKDELAAPMNLKIAKPLPTLVILDGNLEVSELLGVVQSGDLASIKYVAEVSAGQMKISRMEHRPMEKS